MRETYTHMVLIMYGDRLCVYPHGQQEPVDFPTRDTLSVAARRVLTHSELHDRSEMQVIRQTRPCVNNRRESVGASQRVLKPSVLNDGADLPVISQASVCVNNKRERVRASQYVLTLSEIHNNACCIRDAAFSGKPSLPPTHPARAKGR